MSLSLSGSENFHYLYQDYIWKLQNVSDEEVEKYMRFYSLSVRPLFN